MSEVSSLFVEPQTPPTPADAPPVGVGGVIEKSPTMSAAELFREGDAQDAQQLDFLVQQAPDQTPERSARILDIQTRTKMPAKFIADNFDEMDQLTKAQDFDAHQFHRNSPKVADWLKTNPDYIPLVRDDMENLGTIEKIFREAKHAIVEVPPQTVEATKKQMQQSWLSFKELNRELLTPVEQARLEFLRHENLPKESGFAWFMQSVTQGAVQSLAGLALSQEQALGIASAGALAAVAGGPATWPLIPAMGTAGYVVGSLGGMLYQTYWMEAGAAREEFLQIRGREDQPLDPAVVEIASHVVGAVNAPVELLGLGALARTVPGGKNLLKYISRDTVKQVLMHESVQQALLQVTKQLADSTASNALQEAIQEATVIIAGEVSKRVSSGEFESPTMGRQLARIGEAAAGGAAMGFGLGLPGSVVSGAQGVMKAQQAQRQEQFFTALGEATTESKTRERLPGKFQEMVEQLTKDGPVENLYVPVEFYQTHWTNQGLDPRAVAVEMGIEKQYDEATRTEGKIEIPTAIYARRIAPTEHNTVFARELSTSPELMNAREADEFLKQAEKEQEQAAPDVFEESVSKVREDIRGQLTGLFPAEMVDKYAAVYEARIRSRAQRLGIDPFELYQKRPLDISREVPEILKRLGKVEEFDVLLNRMRAGEVPTLQQARGESLLEFVRKQGGLQDQGGELAARDLAKAKPGLVRKKGMTLDEAAGKAMEAGYIKAHDLDEFMAALDEELQGRPRYKPGASDTKAQETLTQMEELDRFLGGLGIDIKTIDNETIKRLLRGAGPEGAISVPAPVAEYNAVQDETFYQKDLFGQELPDQAATPKRAAKPRNVQPAIAVRSFEVEDETTGTYAVETALISERSRTIPIQKIRTAEDAAQAFSYLYDYAVEYFDALVTDKNGKPLAIVGAFKGAISGTAVYPEVLLHEAYRIKGAANIWLSHNHPSGISTLSRADEVLHDRIAPLFDGTEIKLKGLFAIGKNEFTFRDNNGWTTSGKIGSMVAEGGTAVPIIERVFKKNDRLGASLESSSTSKTAVPAIAGEKPGLLLLDNRHQPVAFLPISPDEAGKLKTGGRLDKIYRAMSKANAAAAIIANPNGAYNEMQYVNLSAALSAQDIRPLDVVGYTYDAETKIVSDVTSGSELGTYGYDRGKLFFQRAGLAREQLALERYAEQKKLDLVIGMKTSDGRILSGEKGQSHFHLLQKYPEEFVRGKEFFQPQLGFVDKSGKFYTRGEALEKVGISDSRELFQTQPQQAFYSALTRDIKRGLIRIGADRINIELLKNANLSTFLHETSHLWLDELIEDATAPDSPQQLKDDLDLALKYLDLDAREKDGAEAVRKAITTEHHEKWARSGEAYLMEGKAPSVALRRLFASFRAWLVSIYRAMSRLNVELTPEVRGVFDRLLATDAEIEAAKAEAGVSPLFTTAVEAGWTDTEFEAYRKTVEQASQAAQEELEQKLIRDFMRARKQWWKDERAKIKTEVTAEVDGQKVYKTIAALQQEGGIRLDRKTVVDAYGKNFVKRLPRGVAVIEGGAHADTVAEIVGYGSGQELLMDIASARPRNALIEAETDMRMRETHGDLLTDGGLHDEARKAVQNELRGKVIEAEIKALNKKAREVGPYVKAAQKAEQERAKAGRQIYRALVPNLAQVRDQAARMVAAKKVRDVRPMAYFAAARQASRAAVEAVRKKDYLMAGHQKGLELLNLELYREALKAVDTVETSVDKLKQAFRPDSRLAKTRNVDMVNAARAILSAHGLGRMDKAPMAYLEAMRRYDPEMYENMRDRVESAVQDQVDYRDITVEEFIGLRDSVLALLHTSRRSKQMMVDGQLIDREEAVKQLVARIGEFGQKEKEAGYKRAMTKWEKIQAGLLGARAIMRRTESWVDAMDGGDPAGVFRRYVWNPVSDAVNHYREAKKTVLQKYLDLVKGVEKTLTTDKIDAREIGYTFSGKIELLHAILHTGNESNLSKLLRGRGWGEYLLDDTLDASRWNAFVSRMIREGMLTKADYDFAQGVWDMLDELKPLTQKAHHDMYGYYFDEVTAKSFTNEFGVYRGGYLPAIVDPDVVADAAIRKDKEELLHGQNSFAFPTTGRGATMKRIERYARPLQLDMRTIPAHIDWALRFAYIEPATKDIGRVLINRDLRTALDNLDPAIARHMLMPWLQRTANQAVSTPGMIPWLDKVAKEIRKRTGMQIMVANVINTLQQFTGLTIAMTKVKPHNLRNAFWQYVTHPKAITAMVGEKSLFMRNRIFTQQADIQQALDDLLLNSTKYEKARAFAEHHGYFMQQGTQSIVDRISWIAAYNEATQQNMAETDAVRHADSVVRETQGSFAPEDISRIEAGSPFLRLFLMFYNYFNMQANLLGTEFANITTNQLGLRKGAGRALYLYIFGFMIPAFIGDGLIRALMAGEPDEDDDGYLDDYIGMFFSTQMRTAVAFVPAVGPVIMAGINVWNDKWYDDRITTSPAVSALESAVRSPYSVYKAIVDEGSNKRAIQDTLTAIGLLSGMPVAALARPLGYLADVQEGKAQPENVVDLTRGLISGRDVNREK